MDRKAVIVLAACFVLLMLWYPLMNRLYPPAKPGPAGGTNAVAAAAATNQLESFEPSPVAATGLSSAAEAFPIAQQPGAEERLLSVSRDSVRFTFSSWGGGLKLVELLDYPENPSCGDEDEDDTGQAPVVTLNTRAPAPILSHPNQELLQGDGLFELTSESGVVRASKQLTNGLRVIKEFRLGSNYLFSASVRLENGTLEPIALPAQELVLGTATPLGVQKDTIPIGTHWFNGEKDTKIDASWFQNRTLGCFPGTPRSLYEGGQNDVLWAAVNNQFFTIAAMNSSNAPAPRVVARMIDLPPAPVIPEGSKPDPNPKGYQAAFAYPAQILAPGAALVRDYDFYAGPKEYKTLARIATRRQNELDEIMEFGFFGLFSKFLLLSMNGLHSLGLGYGLAIVVITVIIKLVFWPLTKASTRSMKRMSALQPQMKAIQEKFKDDPRKMNQKLMEFMRENKVNPMGGCLPMLLQIPVFIGFFYMIKSAIELRGVGFLWACDLSQPDTIFVIPGLGFPVNLFPLLMGATQLWQMRLTPPSPGMDPMQQKILQYMPLMFVFILYNFSSGLTLYWTVQNLLSVLQMKLTRNDPVQPAGPVKPAPAGTTPASRPPRRKKKNRRP